MTAAFVSGPRQYASKLAGLLIDAGARPLWAPCVEISALDDPNQISQLRTVLSDLSQFTHIAFSSKNGINAVLHELEHLHGTSAKSVLQESGARLCALGADALALEQAGYDVHVKPQEASTQGLVRELVSRGELEGARVLCPVPHVTGTTSSCQSHVLHVNSRVNVPLCLSSEAHPRAACLLPATATAARGWASHSRVASHHQRCH